MKGVDCMKIEKSTGYKHYLIQITTANYDAWTIYETDNYNEAHRFFDGLFFPSEVTRLELFGTNEEPDTYLTGKTIAYKEYSNGKYIEVS